MTLSECEDIARVLKARSRLESQHGMPREETLSAKAAEAIEYLLMELREADAYADDWER